MKTSPGITCVLQARSSDGAFPAGARRFKTGGAA